MTRSQARVIASFSAGDGLLPARATAYIQIFGRRAIANPSRRGCYAVSPHLVHSLKTARQNRAVIAQDGAHRTKLFAWLGFERLLNPIGRRREIDQWRSQGRPHAHCHDIGQNAHAILSRYGSLGKMKAQEQGGESRKMSPTDQNRSSSYTV